MHPRHPPPELVPREHTGIAPELEEIPLPLPPDLSNSLSSRHRGHRPGTRPHRQPQLGYAVNRILGSRDRCLQPMPGQLPQPLLRHPHSRQRRYGEPRQADVVHPGHRQVRGDGDADLVEPGQQSERHQVVERDHCRHVRLQYRLDRGVPGLDRPAALEPDDLQAGDLTLGASRARSRARFDELAGGDFFVTDVAYLPAIRVARDAYVDTANPPASTAVQVVALFGPDALLEVEAYAIV